MTCFICNANEPCRCDDRPYRDLDGLVLDDQMERATRVLIELRRERTLRQLEEGQKDFVAPPKVAP